MDAIALSLFASRIAAICEEMGAVLARAAISPNIKDRLDYSCAVFDARGELCAQAAHIPVHLGSMAFAMADVVNAVAWRAGDMVVLNDPYLGGTHLPDVTVIAPVFAEGRLVGFVVNRAHHADIGASTPGSMPISSCLDEEGVVIAPTHLMRDGRIEEQTLETLLRRVGDPDQTWGDFAAQMSANRTGTQRLAELVANLGADAYEHALNALNAYGERLAGSALAAIPDGDYGYTDYLDDDGQGQVDLPIAVAVKVSAGRVSVDFSGTAPQVRGNVNCPLAVAAAAVYYVFRCLMPPHTPACAGVYRAITVHAPEGSLVNALRPAACAAGNVETSTRIVDALLGALAAAIPERIPAASHGSMNNVAMGARGAAGIWNYYETVGGGMGAGPLGGGLSAVQTHMTNTRNTPVESLEMHYPLRIRRYEIRRGSGGAGARHGGDGVVREYEFLAPATVTLLTERRRRAPWGLAGGGDGARGENRRGDEILPGKVQFDAAQGEQLSIATPGGGGWGELS